MNFLKLKVVALLIQCKRNDRKWRWYKSPENNHTEVKIFHQKQPYFLTYSNLSHPIEIKTCLAHNKDLKVPSIHLYVTMGIPQKHTMHTGSSSLKINSNNFIYTRIRTETKNEHTEYVSNVVQLCWLVGWRSRACKKETPQECFADLHLSIALLISVIPLQREDKKRISTFASN